MGADTDRVNAVIDTVLDKAKTFDAAGLDYPKWLCKQIDGVALLEGDFWNGVTVLLDGLQDELRAVKAVHRGPV